MVFSNEVLDLVAEAEIALRDTFDEIDRVSFNNTKGVMNAFSEHRVSDAMFGSTSGYGYDDKGRDVLEEIWADVFGCEAALVRHSIANGTHALTIGLFGILRPGDIMLSVAGKPYDTLDEVIGNVGEPGNGSLKDFGISYRQIDLKDGLLDLNAIREALTNEKIKVVFVQRSKGYLDRRTLTANEIGELVKTVKSVSPDSFVYVDLFAVIAADMKTAVVIAEIELHTVLFSKVEEKFCQVSNRSIGIDLFFQNF